mgnify:CR=1 FL=1
MRNYLIFIGVVLVSTFSVMAQERVYVSTDKDVYVAGEDVWYSVHCLYGDGVNHSNLSDVAYLQFVSNDAAVVSNAYALDVNDSLPALSVTSTYKV